MADSTSNLTQLTTSQAGKEATVNELFNAASQAMLFARKQSSSGLSFDLFGGRINVDGVPTLISNQTVTLTASTTNYIECTRAGVVSVNTTGFSADKYPIYKVVTGASTVTSYEDHRKWGVKIAVCRLAKSLATDANATLTQQEADNDIMDISSAVSLTATRDIVLPLNPRMHTVRNNTTGGQSLRFIGATGTGVTVANGISTVIFCDGTNWYQVAPATDATSIAAAIVAAAEKTTPVDADSLGIVDSAASNVLKRLTFANLWAWVKGKVESVALSALSVGNLTVTGTSGTVYASTWTPTGTAVTNVSSVTTYAQSIFLRFGNYVFFSFPAAIVATAAGGFEVTFSLPVSSSLTATRLLTGSASTSIATTTFMTGTVLADTTGNNILLRGNAADTNSREWRITGAYMIN